MIRLAIIVQGPTKKTFVRDLLTPSLGPVPSLRNRP
jgi:hypothetical protein